MSIIRFIQAGGTIDKDYLPTDQHHGYNFVIGESAFHAINSRARIPYAIGFSTACRKDSLDMTGDDRDAVKKMVMTSIEKKIIVLHGSDTIHLTAKHLSDIGNKIIVLVAALRPELFRDSDADFNVGMAVGAVHCLPSGIYIALYGEVKRWDKYVPR